MIMADPSATDGMCGSVVAVSSDSAHGFSKPVRDSINLIEGHGAEGDAHAGRFVRHRYLAGKHPRLPNLRQLHLMPSELFAELALNGFKIAPGALGENVTTRGLDLTNFPLGTRLRMGDSAIVELTGLRTPCVLIDRFKKGLKRELIQKSGHPRFKCGVLGVVKATGIIVPGDPVIAERPLTPWLALPEL
jgi:MOSC domain-containing protein YiiM